MTSYRLGKMTVQDEEAGTLVLEGDGYAAAGELSTLLVSDGAASYLAMTREETTAARALVDAYRAALRALGAPPGEYKPPSLDERARPARERLMAGVQTLFGSERAARLSRLSWRILGGSALVEDEVAARLQLTPSQRSAIADAAAQAETVNQRVLKSISATRQERLMSHQPIEDAARDASAEADSRLLDVLTPEQRQRFEQMKRGTP